MIQRGWAQESPGHPSYPLLTQAKSGSLPGPQSSSLVVEVKRHDVGGSSKGTTLSSGSSPHLLLLWVSSQAKYGNSALESQHAADRVGNMLPHDASAHHEHAVRRGPSRWEGHLPGNIASPWPGEGLTQKAGQQCQATWLPSFSSG